MSDFVSHYQPFEGFWVATLPSGAVAYAKVFNGKLLIPYSLSGGDGKLTGHYYDCRVIDGTFYGRFEQFDTAASGVLMLRVGPNETLQGGRWMNELITESVRQDISCLSESLPGMRPTVWIRMLIRMPMWAEKYFSEDWPNKPSA